MTPPTHVSDESEQLLRATVEGMLDPHLLVAAERDAHGAVTDLRILVANQATLDYWGLPREEVLGAGLLEVLPGIKAAGLFSFWAGALETGDAVVLNDFPYENELLGELLYYDLRAARTPGDMLSISWSDVTPRHRALRTSEEVRRHYQLLAENASDVVFRSDVDGRLVWISQSVTRVLGWDPGLLIGRPLTDLSHPLDRERLRSALERLANGDSQHTEIRMRKADRGHRWMGVALRTALDEGEWSSATFGTFRDIEAEVLARQSLREEQARFEAVKDSSTDAIISINRSGKIIAWNRAADEMFGYSATEAVGKSHRLVVPDRFHGLVTRWLTDMSAPDVIEATRRTHRADLSRRDGSLFPCEYSVAVWDQDGQQHMTAILRDTTEQQAVLDELQASRLELAEAQRLAGAGSWTHDLGTDRWDWSDELRRIFGVPPTMVSPGRDELLRPVSNATEIISAATSAVSRGRATELECDVTRPNGDVRRIQARIAPVHDAHGEIVMVRGTAVDVTELHQASEARLRRTARHADYLTRVEHTLRTHLSVVEGWAGILEASFDDLDPLVRADGIGAIKRNASALVGHVKGLMSEAAEHAKADSIVVGPLDIADVAAAAAEDYRGLSGRAVEAEPVMGVWALGAHDAVDTVARHLIENAVRHTDELGCVEVLTQPGVGDAVELIVRDDGPGIAEGVTLFSAFSKDSRSAGHGLGLHVVRTLVEAMGGTVEGRNRTEGRGAEFIVTLRGLTN